MVSTLQLQEKYNKIRNNFCFYLDIQEPALCRSISRRLQDMGLREEVFLTSHVTHVVLDHKAGSGVARWPRREGRARVDAMLERLRAQSPPKPTHHNYIQLTVQKAINLLDKLYDTFFTPRKAHINYFTKHFIKIEFLDKPCRPVYKEFDEWPQISLEPDPPKEEKKELPENLVAIPSNNNIGPKMTRKSRPRIKEREIKEEKGGYCEMCNVDYADATLHRRSPHHLAFVRDHANFISLDSLITSGADVNTFLDKATPVNGERRSLRKICNGDAEPKSRRSKRSQSPDPINGDISPKRNGGLEEEKKHNTRCSKKTSESTQSEDRQYYKVVGVSTKLRSSGGFTKKKELPTCNGAKPLVVKFRKVRRSELSVLSDEAEQFMFPKRASSTSSTSSDDETIINTKTRKKSSPQLPPPERQRLARPVALKEESSEEDIIWPEDKRRRKRRAPPVVKRTKRKVRQQPPSKPPESKEPDPLPESILESQIEPELEPQVEQELEVSPLREETVEKCMKWEDGRLKYTPAVEQLEFAFESVPHSEPWFETFKRQDEDKIVAKNVPQYFALYTKSPKLPYELGQLPPLKPNCCPLSDLVKREQKPGPSRSYGTRGMKKQRIRKRTAAILALESHPRKSPREHASTLAILGSAGLLHRRRNIDDAKSTASEDTISDTQSKVEPLLTETQENSERLQQFLSEVFDDASDYDVSEDVMENDIPVITSKEIPDVSSLVSECENCDLIRNEIKQETAKTRERRGKFKKKNRTGWPSKKTKKKNSRNSSIDDKVESLDRSSADPELETLSEADENQSEAEEPIKDKDKKSDTEEIEFPCPMDIESTQTTSDKSLLENKNDQSSNSEKRTSSDSEDKVEIKKKKRALQGLCDWLPVVRVARVDPNVTRRLRSAGRARSSKFR